VTSYWAERDKRKKKRLPKDSIALGLVIAISLLLFYAFKLLIDHTQDYYSQLRSPSYSHQTFKIDPDLIAEAKGQINEIKVLNKNQPSKSPSAISGSIDSEIFFDALVNEPDTVDKLTISSSTNEQSKLTISETVVNKKTTVPEIVNIEKANSEIAITQAVSSGETVNSGESWLLAQPKSNYSLQLASFKDPKLMDIFINKQADIKNLDYKKLESKNGWIYLLAGSFISNREAQKAKQAFSFSKDIWVRKIGVLRANRCKNKGLSADHPSC